MSECKSNIAAIPVYIERAATMIKKVMTVVVGGLSTYVVYKHIGYSELHSELIAILYILLLLVLLRNPDSNSDDGISV